MSRSPTPFAASPRGASPDDAFGVGVAPEVASFREVGATVGVGGSDPLMRRRITEQTVQGLFQDRLLSRLGWTVVIGVALAATGAWWLGWRPTGALGRGWPWAGAGLTAAGLTWGWLAWTTLARFRAWDALTIWQSAAQAITWCGRLEGVMVMTDRPGDATPTSMAESLLRQFDARWQLHVLMPGLILVVMAFLSGLTSHQQAHQAALTAGVNSVAPATSLPIPSFFDLYGFTCVATVIVVITYPMAWWHRRMWHDLIGCWASVAGERQPGDPDDRSPQVASPRSVDRTSPPDGDGIAAPPVSAWPVSAWPVSASPVSDSGNGTAAPPPSGQAGQADRSAGSDGWTVARSRDGSTAPVPPESVDAVGVPPGPASVPNAPSAGEEPSPRSTVSAAGELAGSSPGSPEGTPSEPIGAEFRPDDETSWHEPEVFEELDLDKFQ